jgi:CheY-like chemotaxis protein
MKTKQYFFAQPRKAIPQVNFYRALVVDDYNPAKQMLGASLWNLPQIGEIDYAENGEEALSKAGSKNYDLIFLDISMPGLDGFETCSRIREIKGYEITPIILVSGNASPANHFKGAMSGCTSYVTKPIQQEPFRKLNYQMFSWLEAYKAA